MWAGVGAGLRDGFDVTVTGRLRSWVHRKLLGDRRERWNHQYLQGQWEKLKGPLEQERFDELKRLLLKFAPGAQVLEVGCGEALLQRLMPPESYARWVGVDISDVAIARALEYGDDRVHYAIADMDNYETSERFDAIVFTESVNYSADAEALMRRHAKFLCPGGFLFVSMFSSSRSERVWSAVHRVATPLHSSSTSNSLGTWVCEVLQPRADS